jgi:hypothetical protein
MASGIRPEHRRGADSPAAGSGLSGFHHQSGEESLSYAGPRPSVGDKPRGDAQNRNFRAARTLRRSTPSRPPRLTRIRVTCRKREDRNPKSRHRDRHSDQRANQFLAHLFSPLTMLSRRDRCTALAHAMNAIGFVRGIRFGNSNFKEWRGDGQWSLRPSKVIFRRRVRSICAALPVDFTSASRRGFHWFRRRERDCLELLGRQMLSMP